MQHPDPFLPPDIVARLRAPVELGTGARARVMQRIRAAALPPRLAPRSRGMAQPTVLGALLAASFVATVVTAAAGTAQRGDARNTLADTIAMHFAAAAVAARPPVIDRGRLVAVADETRNAAPAPPDTAPARRD